MVLGFRISHSYLRGLFYILISMCSVYFKALFTYTWFSMPKCTLRLAVQLSSTSFQRDLYSGTSLSNLSCSFIHVLFDNKVLTPYTYIISYLMHLVKTSWTYSTPFLDDTCCKKQFFFNHLHWMCFCFFLASVGVFSN